MTDFLEALKTELGEDVFLGADIPERFHNDWAGMRRWYRLRWFGLAARRRLPLPCGSATNTASPSRHRAA